MRILVTGGSGFIGRKLVERLLQRGDSVTALTRNPEAQARREGLRWVKWDPRKDGPWQTEVEGQDGIVHLAAELAGGRRLTESVKREVLESRVVPIQRLAHGIAQAKKKPHVFVSASGVGYYGNRDADTPIDEHAEPGRDFLARTCVEWEEAARQIGRLGLRVVSGRIGFVLGKDGGALARMVPIFKAYAGGPMGSGRQIIAWVHIDDVVGAFLQAIDDPTLVGPMNVVAPNAVSNAVFAETLGRVLKRPAKVPAPAFALKLLFGEGAEMLLTGQPAIPRALVEHRYSFRFVDLETALRDLLDSPSAS